MATKTETLTIRVGPKLRADLAAAAAEDEMTLGEFVRYVLAEHLRRRQRA
jgi:predicted HicB family RNase H-like nuclease